MWIEIQAVSWNISLSLSADSDSSEASPSTLVTHHLNASGFGIICG